MLNMQKILLAIIGIWSCLVFVTVIIDWIRWKPNSESFGGAVKEVAAYRFKMMIKMIIPGFLLIMSALGLFL